MVDTLESLAVHNPLITNLGELTDDQLQKKVEELQKKFFSAPSQHLKDQIVGFLEIYNAEMQERQAIRYEKEKETRDNEAFDDLININ